MHGCRFANLVLYLCVMFQNVRIYPPVCGWVPTFAVVFYFKITEAGIQHLPVHKLAYYKAHIQIYIRLLSSTRATIPIR